GHTILSNRFFRNGRPNGLGIDIANCPGCPSAVTPNDAGDADTGPNDRQNFPVLTTVEDQGPDTHVVGTLNSAANADFTRQLSTADACHPSRYGEGDTVVATFQVHTNGGGDAAIDTTFPGLLAPGQLVTATATDADGNTSEFSRDLSATGPCSGVYVVNDDG